MGAKRKGLKHTFARIFAPLENVRTKKNMKLAPIALMSEIVRLWAKFLQTVRKQPITLQIARLNSDFIENLTMENTKKEELEKLVGVDKVGIFYDIVNEITKLYDMEQVWNNGGKKWTYEYKFRKGGKTLCAFYFKENKLGFMIIFGKDERMRFEEIRSELSSEVSETYDNAETFHDGKWVMFDITNNSITEDLKKLLFIKRKPNIK